MKNIIIYYLLILAPMGVISWLIKIDVISSGCALFLIFFYILIYRTYVDGKRLAAKNVISKKDIWKMIIPGKHFEYFKELYLQK